MAAYFIKYKFYRGYGEDDGHSNIIIDFNKFEKVNSESIYTKIREGSHLENVEIEDIVKL